DTDLTYKDLHSCGYSPEGNWSSPLTTHLHAETWNGRVTDTTNDIDSGYVQVTSAYSVTVPPQTSYDTGVLSAAVVPQVAIHFHRESGTTYRYSPGDQDMTLSVVEDPNCPPLRR